MRALIALPLLTLACATVTPHPAAERVRPPQIVLSPEGNDWIAGTIDVLVSLPRSGSGVVALTLDSGKVLHRAAAPFTVRVDTRAYVAGVGRLTLTAFAEDERGNRSATALTVRVKNGDHANTGSAAMWDLVDQAYGRDERAGSGGGL